MTPDPLIAWTDPDRERHFSAWLQGLTDAHGLNPASVRSASADASFRRYFRVDAADGSSRIIMDAPPAQENCRPFVDMAHRLGDGGLHAPQVLAWDEPQGFMLLSDLGSRTYLAQLQSVDVSSGPGLRQADQLYLEALDALVRLQTLPTTGLAPYDAAFFQREMDLFPDWYIAKHRAATLSDDERHMLAASFEVIKKVCCAQAPVLVHRDFHSRNLMVCAPHDAPGAGPSPNPGILDFQDAVAGPATYDVVSLLRDAYIAWDESIQIEWAVRYWEKARKAGVPVDADFGNFWRDLDWMGLQRHLKVLGIFARLSHRDGKDAYLQDIPQVWQYAHLVSSRYSVLRPLSRLLERLGEVEVREGLTF